MASAMFLRLCGGIARRSAQAQRPRGWFARGAHSICVDDDPCNVRRDFQPFCIGDVVKKPSPIRVTLIEGHGPGPVVCAAVRKILKAADVSVQWDRQAVRVHRNPLTDRLTVNANVLQSAAETGLVLLGPTAATSEDGSGELTTLTLCKALRASVGVHLFKSVDGHQPFGRVHMINVHDNVSAEFSEIEHIVTPDVVQSIKTVTWQQSESVARFAFDYALANGHFHVTALHKANVMRMSDGMFLDACRWVHADYPDIEYAEEKLDKFCLRVVEDPCRYDMLLAPSLYGAIASAACSVLAGGAATVPFAAFGPTVAVFGTMYDGPTVNRGVIFDHAIFNPTGMIRAAAWILGHVGMHKKRLCIETALNETIRRGVKTRDMDGAVSCQEYTDTIVRYIEQCSS